ncbi:hypothetical protein QA640_24090 [Bradyrhizobium sp. CB82]|uniref:HipA family kinase n=1 Tax=Bradyrhizobium sp. CB82 TaxID=3039159 RepID=UPI0024B18B95|nr:HipA family kinase [Bradyrhizobium sp. CB82]WFU37557.1 hypothetical protein QA640_24090 [Bradyrhizobium sp. CB82]
MLERVTAVEYVRPMSSGRTAPLLLACERGNGSTIYVVAKFSASCDEKEVSLAREVIAACLAADLRLPVPEPVLIEIPSSWSDVISDGAHRARVRNSNQIAFGSVLVTGGFAAWTPDTHVQEASVDTALGIFAFDAIIQNVDRRSENPNCLVRGEHIRIIDHELAFAARLILGWNPPWRVGGLSWLEQAGKHIFRKDLRRRGVDLRPVGLVWSAISDLRLADYRDAIPAEWRPMVDADVDTALTLIRDARDNIAGCLDEIKRVLS